MARGIRYSEEFKRDAVSQVTDRGYLVADVANRLGVSKTSMYKHFRSKDDLILAVLRLRDENFRNWFVRRVEELARTPKDRLLAMFDALGKWFAQKDFRSCLFIKAASEYQDRAHPIHVTSAEHKRLLFFYVRDLAQKAGVKKPDNLAAQLMLLKEGAIVTAHMLGSKDVAADAKSAAQALLREAL